MSDTSSIRDTPSIRSLSRASTFLNRPHFAPMGPRARQSSLRTPNLLENAVTPPLSSLDSSGPRSLSSSPAPPSPTTSEPSSRPTSLPAVSEEPTLPSFTFDDLPERSLTPEVASISQLSESEPAPVSVPSYFPSPAEVVPVSPPTFAEIKSETSSTPTPTPPPLQSNHHPPAQSHPSPTVQAPVVPPTTNFATPLPTKSEATYIRASPSPAPSQSSSPPVWSNSPPPASVSPPPATYAAPPAIKSEISTFSSPAPAQEKEKVQAQLPTPESEPSPSPAPAPAPAQSDSAKVIVPAVPVVLSPARFVPPPAIKFESAPVEWKGLTHEAALWTVDSSELQEIVSRAIRSSAKESFIRLLTVNNLDVVLPAELERLDNLRAVTQSKYRFLVHRRTMLFHALNSSSLSQQKDGDDGVSVVSRLASQLGDTIAECDQNLEQVINITDQMAQIHKLIDIHWSSALAIALRKLNGSYARRTSDLNGARERIRQLESELGEAWKEAEKMAKELDDYEAAIIADDADAVIETAEVVAVPKTNPLAHTRRSSTPMTPTLLAFTPVSPPKTPPLSPTPLSAASLHHQFIFPPVVHLKAKETEAEDVPDTVSLRSTRSTRSAKSTKSHRSGWTAESSSNNNYTSVVHAAKTRSHRRSESSLRLNTGQHSKKQSHGSGRVRTPYEDHPPVPELPLQFTPFNNIMSAASANASSTLLHDSGRFTPQLRRQVSLDSVHTGVGRPAINLNTYAAAYRGRAAAVDDLYVRLQNQFQYEHRNRSSQEIQLVPRTPPPAQNFASMYEYHASMPTVMTAPRPPPKDTSKSIPSMWMNADSRKSQALQIQTQVPIQTQGHGKKQSPSLSRSLSKSISPLRSPPSSPSITVPTSPAHSQPSASSRSGSEVTQSSNATGASNLAHQNSTRNSTYSKLRGLTKRYSVSLPLFNSQTRLPSRRSG